MSLIMFVPDYENYVTACCKNCSAIVAEHVPIQELAVWAKEGLSGLCFDCDPVGVDDIPRQLFCPLENYIIGLGDKVFLAEWLTDDSMPSNKDLRMHKISHTTFFDLKTGFGPAFQSLSSSLNLNTKSKKSGAFFGDRRGDACSQ